MFFVNANREHSERLRMSLAVVQRPNSWRYLFDAGDKFVSMNDRGSGSCTQHDKVRSFFLI